MENMEKTIEYLIGDEVKIKVPTEDMDPEDYYYLLGFQNKIGTIEKIEGDERYYYHVAFEQTIGVFYEEDLIYIR